MNKWKVPIAFAVMAAIYAANAAGWLDDTMTASLVAALGAITGVQVYREKKRDSARQ